MVLWVFKQKQQDDKMTNQIVLSWHVRQRRMQRATPAAPETGSVRLRRWASSPSAEPATSCDHLY